MHRLLALLMVTILALSVTAADSGINKSTNLAGTGIEAIYAAPVITELSDFDISIVLTDDAANNGTSVEWITQICINSGICYPPEAHVLESSDGGKTWDGIVAVDEDATYLNWRIDLKDSDNSTTRVPESGFGWKIWSDCWFDNGTWGGTSADCQENQDDDSLPGFTGLATLVVVSMAALIARRE